MTSLITRRAVTTPRDGLEILAPGPSTTIQDLGRPGLARLGVGMSGAADRAAFLLANRLVGNEKHAAGLETTYGGLAFRALRPLVAAVTGAPVPLWLDGRPESVNCQLYLPTGAELRLGSVMIGVRSYVAIRGGIDVPCVLGSRSTDQLAGLGPPIPRCRARYFRSATRRGHTRPSASRRSPAPARPTSPSASCLGRAMTGSPTVPLSDYSPRDLR